jgi:hypothetical protein
VPQVHPASALEAQAAVSTFVQCAHLKAVQCVCSNSLADSRRCPGPILQVEEQAE